MSNAQIAKVLNQHSVPFYEKDGKIFADSMEAHSGLFEKVENMTGWNRQKLFDWLGY